MIPDEVGKELTVHAEMETGGTCLQVPQESNRKKIKILIKTDPFELPLF